MAPPIDLDESSASAWRRPRADADVGVDLLLAPVALWLLYRVLGQVLA